MTVPARPGRGRLGFVLLLIGLTGVALGGVSLRVWAILRGRLDPDLVTTPEAAAVGLIASGLVLGLVVLIAIVAWRGPRWAPRDDRSPDAVPARRTGRVGAVLVGTSLGLIGIATTGLLVSGDLGAARLLWLVLALGGLLLAPTAAVFAWLADDVATRERSWPGVVMALLAIVAVVPPAVNIAEVWQDRTCWASVECRWMVVQADQLSDDPRGPTTDLHYGIRHADRERRGTLVIATGGPGISGIAAYAQSEATLDPRLTDWYDIVAFDARGVGDSGYRDCPVASGIYEESFDREPSASIVEAFVWGCLAEADVDPSELSRFGSDQVVEDIETIRLDLGLDRIALYGESYGTVVVQRYALAHPDRVEALILDGPLDVATATDRSWAEATAAFERTLATTFAACGRDPSCAEDLPDPDGAWQRVFAGVDGRLELATYADQAGAVRTWPMSRADIEGTLLDALYDETGRMLVLRALAAAERDDWVPMARLVHAGGGYGVSGSASSDFGYYATMCADRILEAAEAGVGPYLQAARIAGLTMSRTGSVYLSGAPCHAWPAAPGPAPSMTLPADLDFPVVVLTSSADPITPEATAYRLVERYRSTTDASIVVTAGGPHVTFGRGDACPDDVVVGLLVDDAKPRLSVISCPGELVDQYLPLVRRERGEDDLSFLARSLDMELLANPDYAGWAGHPALAIGCRFGGRLQVTQGTDADTIEVRACQVVKGQPMTGTGSYRDDGSAVFDATFARGTFHYEVDTDGRARWSGTYDGRAVADHD